MMALDRWVLYGGRTWPAKARVKQNGIWHVCIQDDNAIILIPEGIAVEAPKRSTPRLVWENPNG